jgi:hypothetical protein
MDGKDIISLLMAIQLQGASSVYNSCNLCAFNNAEFTGQQPLWLSSLAEDLLQVGVYVSRASENEDIAICNLIEQAQHLANIFSFRKQRKLLLSRKLLIRM